MVDLCQHSGKDPLFTSEVRTLSPEGMFNTIKYTQTKGETLDVKKEKGGGESWVFVSNPGKTLHSPSKLRFSL